MRAATLLWLLPGCHLFSKAGLGDTGARGGGEETGEPVVYDEGCITVDGQGGYAWLNDAIAVADEGSVIELCAEEAHEEAVVVDKAVSIVGPGPDAFTLVAPTNQPGFLVTADGASISGVSVSSTRAAFEVDGAGAVTLSDVQAVEPGTWGLKAEDATDLVVTDAIFMGGGFGGVEIDGGSASLVRVQALSNTAFGVKATGGAQVSLEECALTSTATTGSETTVDGVGLAVEDGASAVAVDCAIESNDLVGVYGDSGDVEVEGGRVAGSAYGVVVFYGDAVISDVEVADCTAMGVWAAGDGPVSVSGASVTTDPDASVDLAYDEWGGSSGILGTGIALVAPEIELADTTVEGWNDCGVFLAPYDDAATATVDRVTVSDTGRYGFYLQSVSAAITDSEVTGLRDPDDVDDTDCSYLAYIAGVFAYQADLDWTGGSIHDNEGWGISGIYAVVALDGAELHGNECASVASGMSTVVATNSTFSGPTRYGAVYSLWNSGDALVGNTFADSQNTEDVVYEYDYMDTYGYRDTYTYHDQPSSVDAVFWLSDDVLVEGNTFSTGDYSLQVYGTSAVITANTWTDYRGDVVALSYAYDTGAKDPTPATATLEDLVFSGFDGNAISCWDSDLALRDSTLEDGGTFSYSYEWLREYADGSTTGTSATIESVYGGIYSSGCTLSVENTTISGLDGRALYLSGWDGTSTADLVGVDISDVNRSSGAYYGAIYALLYGGEVAATLQDVSVDAVNRNDGLEVVAYSSYGGTFSLGLSGVEFSGVAGSGLDIAGDGALSATLDGVTVTGAGSTGARVSGTALTVTNSVFSGNGASGLLLDGTTGSVTANAMRGNASYGMECSGAVIDDCSSNDLSGNGLGEQTGCGEACGVEANP